MTTIADRLKQRLAALPDRSPLIGIAIAAYRGFVDHDAMARAAAIAYYSILTLFPFVMLGLVAASLLIGSGQALDVVIRQVADAFGLDPATVRSAIASVRKSQALLAGLGLGLLVIAVAPWISAVQRGIARAFGDQRRSRAHATLGSLLVLGTAAVLILLSGVWSSLIDVMVGLIERFLPGLVIADLTLRFALYLLPGVVVFGVMTVLLRVIPGGKQTLPDVWLGSLVTAIGFIALRIVFDIYVQLFVAGSGGLAGPFGAILVGLLYVDFLAIAVLAGAEVAAAVVHRRDASS
ncbi:MAG: YihY/virulence factor BrkB family protein [Chloroflexota bacterium]|nr:YihY/virulence factor BrkB family protein [Chloroflexota bacterium]